MQVQYSATCRTDPNCEIRIGESSWNASCKSIKYTWFISNGNAARGGEFPWEAAPQMVEAVMQHTGEVLEFFDLNTGKVDIAMKLRPGGGR